MKKLSRFSARCSIAVVMLGLFGGCAEHQEFKHNPVAVLPMGSLSRSWFVDLDLKHDRIYRLDVRDKLVYVYTQSKRVIAFDRKAGTIQLSLHVKSPTDELMPLVELKDRLVFPNATSLEVYDTKGNHEKSIELNRPLRGNASGENETVYFGSAGPNGGLVESYTMTKPYAEFNWEYMTHDGRYVTAGTATLGDDVYSASEGGEVDAVNAGRSQIWDTDHGNFLVYGPISADLKVDEYGLYIASRDYSLYCVDRLHGKLKWQYFAGAPLNDSPVTTSDSVYQYVPGQGLAALDKVTGPFDRTPRWIHKTATQFLAQDEKYAYLADPHPNPDDSAHPLYSIIAVDKQTMQLAFASSHADFTVMGTNRKDNLIYAGYADGKIFALKPVLKAGQIGELVMASPAADIANAD